MKITAVDKFLMLLFIALTLQSCGEKRGKSQTGFSFSVGALVNGTPMDGGIYMEAKRYEEGEVVETVAIDLPADHTVILTAGTWDLHFAGFTGPSEWSGTNYCGGVLKASLVQESETIDIILNTSNCAAEPYISMIASKTTASPSNWDGANWDAGIWGP